MQRYTKHFNEKGHLSKESSKNQRQLAATIPLFNHIYLIQKDVSRTMCVFDQCHQGGMADEPIDSS